MKPLVFNALKALCKAFHKLFYAKIIVMQSDAKQFTGLENSQSRSGNKLNFHFNTALTTINIAKIMQLSNPDTRENSFSMTTYKILFHNTLLLSRFFRLFAINPNSIKNHQHVKELLYFGTMAA